jgi:hypothetical protein
VCFLGSLGEQYPRRGVATNNSKGSRSLQQRRFLSNKCFAYNPINEGNKVTTRWLSEQAGGTTTVP